jgi:hypothetical protein
MTSGRGLRNLIGIKRVRDYRHSARHIAHRLHESQL